MSSISTKQAIEIIRRMDLKVAVPPKFEPPKMEYAGAITSESRIEYIHVPSVISELIFEIQQKEREIEDVKRATAILLDIKRSKTNDQ